jgi:hypothetical protein
MFRWLWQHLFSFVHICIVFGLFATAVLDMEKIIYGYIYDNKMTLVKLVNVDESMNSNIAETVEMCVDFEYSPFQAFWKHTLEIQKISNQPFDTFEFMTTLSQKYFNIDTRGAIDLTLKEYVTIAQLSAWTRNMDMMYYVGASNRNEIKIKIHSMKISHSQDIQIFLENPIAETLHDLTWEKLRPVIVRQYTLNTNRTEDEKTITFRYFIDNGVCFYIELPNILSTRPGMTLGNNLI